MPGASDSGPEEALQDPALPQAFLNINPCVDVAHAVMRRQDGVGRAQPRIASSRCIQQD